MRDAAEPACAAVRLVAQKLCRVDMAVPSSRRSAWRNQVKSAL